MDIYEAIGKKYAVLFPVSGEMMEFIESGMLSGSAAYLDVGCADGGLVLKLAARSPGSGQGMVGVDPTPSMIASARERAARQGLRCRFGIMDMATLAGIEASRIPTEAADPPEKVSSGLFGQISCLGNTLPHASSLREIGEFFSGAFRLLQPGGFLTIQLLNYDYLVENRIHEFPLIQAEGLRFERRNEYAGGKVLFHTRLVELDTGKTYEGCTTLLPIRWVFFQKVLPAAGFEEIRRFAGFREDPFPETGGHPPYYYVVRARKPLP